MGSKLAVNLPQQLEHWPIDKLIPFASNPRTHSETQIAQIAASIQEFGWTNPILVGAEDDIIAGHGRLLAARLIGMADVPVIRLPHLTAAQRRALVIADNQLALNAGWDEDLLRLELAALRDQEFDLDLVGFEADELARLLAQQGTAEGLTDEDAIPEIPAIPTSVQSDIWLMGEHKLLVGDAKNPDDVEMLMGMEAADLIFIDPPYNCDYTGYTEEKLKIQNDHMSPEDFKAFLRESLDCLRRIVKAGASLYVCHPSSLQREFQNALEVAGFEVRCQLIWAKNTFAWGFGRYKFRHEPIFYCHVAGQKDAWYGDKSQSTLWEENKPAANRLHPTMKPVELVERALINSSKAGDIVADFFGGAGSTLIACERQGRKARLMEIDPRYADVICVRYQEYTGKPAVLDGDVRSFAEIAAERRKEAA